MNQKGKYFIVEKHFRRGWDKKSKGRGRMFFEEGEMEKQRALAKLYSEERKIDFLIVKVVEEISKPDISSSA